MKLRRKFNLGRIGYKYESIEIEVEGGPVEDLIKQIDQAWTKYVKAIEEKRAR